MVNFANRRADFDVRSRSVYPLGLARLLYRMLRDRVGFARLDCELIDLSCAALHDLINVKFDEIDRERNRFLIMFNALFY